MAQPTHADRDRVVVEGPLVDPHEGVHALVVETDRVVIGVANRTAARLVELRDGAVTVRPWDRHDLTAIDAAQAAAGRRLVTRWADRAGAPWQAESPWHVSCFERPDAEAAPASQPAADQAQT